MASNMRRSCVVIYLRYMSQLACDMLYLNPPLTVAGPQPYPLCQSTRSYGTNAGTGTMILLLPQSSLHNPTQWMLIFEQALSIYQRNGLCNVAPTVWNS